MNDFYERYHYGSKLQRKIINQNNFTYRGIIPIINKYVRKGTWVLDLGCGVGTICIYLASKGANVMGIDISKRAIRIANSNAKLVDKNNRPVFKNLDISSKFNVDKFDVILALEVLEHISDDKQIIISLKKRLNKHGIVIASSPSSNAPLYRLGYLHKFDQNVGHLRRYDENTFKRLFINNGFKILSISKTDGIIGSLLFTNPILNKLVRFIKWPISVVVKILDDFSINLFGESDLIVVAQKV